MFDHVEDACRGAAVLRRQTSVDAVEMFDRASIKECTSEKLRALVPGLDDVGEFGSALLIECRGKDAAALQKRCARPLSPPRGGIPPPLLHSQQRALLAAHRSASRTPA